ncbi:MAG: hypothetical protein ACREXW_11520, partial [Gammaproteobacteria bacterium]
KFKKALSEGVLNELGKATRYCHRVRQLTPYRMVMTLMALFAGAMAAAARCGGALQGKPDLSLVQLSSQRPWDSQTPSSFLTGVTAPGQSEAERQEAYRGLLTVHAHDGQLTQTRDAWRTGTSLGNDRFKGEVQAMLGRKVGESRRGRPKKDSEEYPVKGSDPFIAAADAAPLSRLQSPRPY